MAGLGVVSAMILFSRYSISRTPKILPDGHLDKGCIIERVACGRQFRASSRFM
jgi:hypothetical protein